MIQKLFISVIFGLLLSTSCKDKTTKTHVEKKPVICILGGTPSTKEVVGMIPDALRKKYRFISFNRPGFGGSANEIVTKEKIYQLAKEAGLDENDFGVIGISGGASMAILLASEFKLKHCGIISGMVPKEPYFKHANKAITNDLFTMALGDYGAFYNTVMQFPNANAIIELAGAPSADIAVRACYDEFNFILSDDLFANNEHLAVPMDWYHGDQDSNIPLAAIEEFLKNMPKTKLHIIEDADHGMAANLYIVKLIASWE